MSSTMIWRVCVVSEAFSLLQVPALSFLPSTFNKLKSILCLFFFFLVVVCSLLYVWIFFHSSLSHLTFVSSLFAFLFPFTSQPGEMLLNSFLVAPSLSPLAVSGSPPSNDNDFFLFIFSEQNAIFQTCDDAICCSFLQWWQNLGGTQQEHCGVHSEQNASAFIIILLVFFDIHLYSKTTTTLEENLMTESDSPHNPNAECSRISPGSTLEPPTTNRELSLCQVVCFHSLCNSTGRFSSWVCRAAVSENKVTRIAQS